MHSWLDVSMVAEQDAGDSALMAMSSRTRERVLAETGENSCGRRTCGTEHSVGGYATCAGVRQVSGIVREPDYLEYLSEAERKAVDPDQ